MAASDNGVCSPLRIHPSNGSNLAYDPVSNTQKKVEKMKAVLLPLMLMMSALLLAQDPDVADPTGWPGDNFSLQGALDLFSRSKNPGKFEEALNSPDQQVNNLDLNNDGQVDYIRVVDHKEGDAHAIILEDPVNGGESQDVAVMELEKTGPNTAEARITGDEALFGPDVSYEKYTEVHGKRTTVVVNVWAWPSVRYLYGPSYAVWVSPWSWGRYPRWFRPWHPHPWRIWYGYGFRYRPFFRPYRGVGFRQAEVVYVSHRRVSPMVVSRPRPTVGIRPTAPRSAAPAAVRRSGHIPDLKAAPVPRSRVAPAHDGQSVNKHEARTARKQTRKAAHAARRGRE